MADFTFNPNDLHRLNRLMFTLRGVQTESTGGGHRTRRAGDGFDFLDFTPYTPGDDVRQVDWNLFGRMRQLFIRRYEVPRQLSCTLLVDVSRSMLFGSPITKLHQAQRLASGLGFIAGRAGDKLFASAFADGITQSLGPISGARSLPALVQFLRKAETGGISDLLQAVNQLRARRQHRGLIIVISDFLNVARCEEALSLILAGGGRFLAIQVTDGLDRGVGLEGNVRLRDSETGRMVDVQVDSRNLAAYQTRFTAHQEQLEQFCARRGQHYLPASTADNYIELVCDALRARAILR